MYHPCSDNDEIRNSLIGYWRIQIKMETMELHRNDGVWKTKQACFKTIRSRKHRLRTTNAIHRPLVYCVDSSSAFWYIWKTRDSQIENSPALWLFWWEIRLRGQLWISTGTQCAGSNGQARFGRSGTFNIDKFKRWWRNMPRWIGWKNKRYG